MASTDRTYLARLAGNATVQLFAAYLLALAAMWGWLALTLGSPQ